MNLQGIVAVSGKPGLWKALAQNKTGFILESLDDKKTKLVANLSTAKLAALEEITVFGLYDDIKLKDVFERMKTAGDAPDAKADGKKLREYFRTVAPDHDEEKVYSSDMKKIVAWFNILKDMPVFNEEAPVAEPAMEEAPEAPATETETEDASTEEKPKAKAKSKAKKAE
jgi:hypothetical protein